MGSLSGCVQGSDTCQTCLCAGEEVCVIAVHHRRTPVGRRELARACLQLPPHQYRIGAACMKGRQAVINDHATVLRNNTAALHAPARQSRLHDGYLNADPSSFTQCLARLCQILKATGEQSSRTGTPPIEVVSLRLANTVYMN